MKGAAHARALDWASARCSRRLTDRACLFCRRGIRAWAKLPSSRGLCMTSSTLHTRWGRRDQGADLRAAACNKAHHATRLCRTATGGWQNPLARRQKVLLLHHCRPPSASISCPKQCILKTGQCGCSCGELPRLADGGMQAGACSRTRQPPGRIDSSSRKALARQMQRASSCCTALCATGPLDALPVCCPAGTRRGRSASAA